ncbi:MAG TPA: GNAT family N-acetyltransferase [Actinomycetales bacterium]|nr:GNAT family N-acetyltransferase [Actinomycetales bacterium]
MRLLQRADLPEVLALCSRRPIDSVLAAARFQELAIASNRGIEGWGWPRNGPLQAVCWAGANLVPVLSPDLSGPNIHRAIGAFATHAIRTKNRSSSLVGEQAAVMELWRHLSRSRTARDVRANQPSLILDDAPRVSPDPHVRVTRPDEFDTLFPASIAMFTEEVGYSPTDFDGGASYSARVRYLISRGRSYVRTGRNENGEVEVIFKAEVGALTAEVAQIQGVWVAPKYRGRGLSVSGMAAVVEHVREAHAPIVSLYVNDYNEPALRSYHSVGFRQVGAYATILF